MFEKLMRAVQQVLEARWNARLPDILAASKAAAADLGPEETYRMAYRQAYWDAVVDLAEAGLLRTPSQEVRIGSLQQPMSSDFH